MKTLLAGPWIGEFGWEIIKWVPFLRKYISNRYYDKVFVFTRESSFPLYLDLGVELIPHECTGDTKIYVCNNTSPEVPSAVLEYLDPDEVLIPSEGSMYGPPERYSYYMYGEKKDLGCDIIAHARDTGKTGSYRKNWKRDNWDLLVQKLQANGRRISFIGSPESSYCSPGGEDLRGLSLSIIMNVLRSSNLCIGPSSGPMHLASCCGCPHIVWGDSRLWNSGNVKSNLEERYKVLWNPFETLCEYISDENWNPSVDEVFIKVLTSLNR